MTDTNGREKIKMASEIQATYSSGKTVYALIRNSTGSIWNGSAFVAYDSGDIATYAVSLTEQSTSGFYAGTFPAGITAGGIYGIIAKEQIGGSVAETDPTIALGDIQWNGTATLPLSSLATSGQVAQFAPMRIARGTQIAPFPFKLVGAADHITPFTSGVISGQISRDGGAFGALQSGVFTEIGKGWYSLAALTSGDLLANAIALVFTANGISGGTSDQRDFSFLTQRVSGV